MLADAVTKLPLYAHELGSVRLLQTELDRRGIRSKARVAGNGARTGGSGFSRGALYVLLTNPIYIGEISHKGERFPGQHEAILDRPLWDAVQARLQSQGVRRRGQPGIAIAAPLAGKLFDEAGSGLTPSYAIKKGKRYGYYVSRRLVLGTVQDTPPGWRLPARQIEAVVAAAAAEALDDRAALAKVLGEAGVPVNRWPAALDRAAALRRQLLSESTRGPAMALVRRVDLRRGALRLTLSLAVLLDGAHSGSDRSELVLEHEVSLEIKRRGVEMKLVIESPGATSAKVDPILLKEIARAHRCVEALLTGDATNLAVLAAREGVSDRYISRLLPLAFLAPEIVEAITAGRQPADLTAHKLIRHTDLPIDWRGQKRLLGFS